MIANAEESDSFEELAQRESDGIDVSLLWSRASNRLSVLVFDTRLAEGFEVAAHRGNALDVFYHPFAYAGCPGTAQPPSMS